MHNIPFYWLLFHMKEKISLNKTHRAIESHVLRVKFLIASDNGLVLQKVHETFNLGHDFA